MRDLIEVLGGFYSTASRHSFVSQLRTYYIQCVELKAENEIVLPTRRPFSPTYDAIKSAPGMGLNGTWNITIIPTTATNTTVMIRREGNCSQQRSSDGRVS